jgi:serine/threonine protein kinase
MEVGEAAKPGPRTVGRYIVYGEIASGGMATVHFGRLTGVAGFARSVAIKRLHPQYARDPDFVKMFLDEARLAARIAHPNVVSTLDVVSVEEELLLVMDYVRGVSLAQLLRIARVRGERIPPLITTGIMAGVLHGLHAAHEAKSETGERLDIVHRDVSPQNVLIGTDGVARVLDFGVAKAAGRLQTTRDGQLKGKLSYMAPEQIHGSAVTRRTDVYSASVVLWEALTGERLFKGDNEGNILARIISGEVPPPSAIVPGLPAALDRVVLRGLERDAALRYATAREMAQDIDASFGLASSAEIGDWVEHVAAQDLEKRARRIADIENATTDDDTQTTVFPSSPGKGAPDAPTPVGRRVAEEATGRSAIAGPDPSPSQVSSVSLAQSSAPSARTPKRTALIAVAATCAAVFLVAIGAAVGSRHTDSTSPADSVAAPALPGPASSGPPALPTTVDTPAPPDTTVTPVATASSPEALPHAPPLAPTVGGPRPGPRPAAGPGGAPAPAAGADCNPPYTTDAKGHVHFKPQCM